MSGRTCNWNGVLSLIYRPDLRYRTDGVLGPDKRATQVQNSLNWWAVLGFNQLLAGWPGQRGRGNPRPPLNEPAPCE